MKVFLTVAHKCHDRTKEPRQNQKTKAKQKAMTKRKPRQQKTSKMKNSRQNKIDATKLKSHS